MDGLIISKLLICGEGDTRKHNRLAWSHIGAGT